LVVVEAGHMRAGRADAEHERLPPLLERRMLDADRERSLFDVAQSGSAEQLTEMTLSRSCQAGLVGHGWIEATCRLPEHAQRSTSTVVVPDTRHDDPAPACDAAHLTQAGDRVGHEVHDELRQGSVERRLAEGKPLGGGESHIDIRVALLGRIHERL
jgi:hypothetical protein